MGTGVFIKGRGEAARLRGRLFSSRLTSRLRFARRQDSLGAAEECRKNRYIQAASLVTSSKRTRVISRECRSGSVRNAALESLCKVGSVVGVDLGVVASTRHRHIRKPAIHKFLARLLRVHVHEHAVRGLPLAAVARHCVPVIKMRILSYVEYDSAA